MNNWWSNASAEQRLAQIDGGIECGLSAREIAGFSRLTDGVDVIRTFARRHDRRCANQRNAAIGTERRLAAVRARRAFIAGEAIDFWNNAQSDTTVSA